MSESNEAQLTYWIDVLEEVVNGRIDGHACPFCSAAPLRVVVEGAQVEAKCSSCGEFFKGRMS